MNNKGFIDIFDTITRVKLGHKCDSVFRTCRVAHSKDQEFGATEAKAKYNVSSEHFDNSFVKLPTTLKDMIYDLMKTKPYMYESLHTVVFIHSELSSTMLHADKPTRNITRITRQEPIIIINAIKHFGETALPVRIATDVVKSIFDILNVPPPAANDENEDDFSWIRGFLFLNSKDYLVEESLFSTLNNLHSLKRK